MSIDQLFNEALQKGRSDFQSDYGYDENCGKHKKRLNNAKKKLCGTLTTNDPPNYDDPFIVDAYLDDYHLKHCQLASWVFSYFFSQLGSIPNALYVCDVGAGTQAGCVGLASALSKYKEKPAIYFDAYEPSNEMWSAGYYVWSVFRDSIGANFDPEPCGTLPHRLPDNLPDNALRIVTAFHLSLPYNNKWKENDIGEKALNSLEQAFCLVSPKYGLFTCHKNKENSLKQAVDNSSYIWNKEKGSKPVLPYPPENLPKDSILLWKEVERGFK